MKKVLILYDSVYGNTKSIAMALSRGLEAGNFYVDCISIQGFDIGEIKKYDVIGIGGPTHFHGTSKVMKSFLRKITHLDLENRLGFAFETKGDLRLGGSAAKRIMKSLKKMNIELVNHAITGIVLDKEGSLQDKSLERAEQIGLNISEKINSSARLSNLIQGRKVIGLLNNLKWILIGGGPIFFFIRALYLASTGGDCFGTINPGFSWFLLVLEIVISGIAGVAAIVSLILVERGKNNLVISGKFSLKKFVLVIGIISFYIHFLRVGIWIGFCVI